MPARRLFTALMLGLGFTLAVVWLLGGGQLSIVRAASFTVDIFTDENDSSCTDGDCSLRDAIIIANGNGEADVITLGAGTYALSLNGTGEDGGATGDLDITDALTIVGLGPDQTIIDASGVISDRVFHIQSGAGTVVISGVTIMNGNVNGLGGGLYARDADLTLVNVIVSRNVVTGGGGASGFGGGLYAQGGNLTLDEVQVVSNTASGQGGGACLSYAAVTLRGGQVLSNTTVNGSGGGIHVSGDTSVFTQTGATRVAYNVAGSDSGGICIDRGRATLNGARVFSNTAMDGHGGGLGIWYAHVTVSALEVVSNTASRGGGVCGGDSVLTQTGQMTIAHNVASGNGGGAYISYGSATFGAARIVDNVADTGGGVYVSRGSAILSGTQVVSNAASAGGGLRVDSFGAVTLNGGAILSNTASSNGGGVYVDGYSLPTVLTQTGDSLIAFNVAGSGGGVYVGRGRATLSRAQIRSNTARDTGIWDGGGGLFATADVTLDDVQIVSNTSNSHGGGVHLDSTAAMLSVNRGQITHNTAQARGGGLYNLNGALTLLNTTVSGNTATTDGGGLYNGGTSVLTFTTVASNTAADDGGGIYNSGGGTVLLNTLLAHNGPTNCSGAITSDGYNLDSGVSCGLSASGDITDTDPLIGPLDAEGVHPLLPGSPAINHGLCVPGVTTDQRGMPRSQVAGCDIGAYEAEFVAPLEKVTISGPSSAAVGVSVEFVAAASPITASQPITYVWQATDQTPETHTGGVSDAVSFAWDTAGVKTITVTASNITSTVQATYTVELSLMPVLVIAKVGPAEVVEGHPITYTLTVTNVGSAAAENLVITDALPTAAYYLSGGAYDPVGHAATWTVSSLAAGGGVVQVHLAIAAAQTVVNADYRVSASGGYSAAGDAPVVTVVAPASLRYVAPDGSDDQNFCGYNASPCATIQHAVDVASAGNEIRVAAGTYTGTQLVVDSRTGYTYTQVVFITKTLTLRGGYDAGNWNADPDPTANPTVIDAERQGRCVSIVGVSDDWPAVTVDGFTVTGGDYTGLHNASENGEDRGGGLYAYYGSLTLRHSVVFDNIAGRDQDSSGGGIYIGEAHADTGTRIEHTLVISNSAPGSGGFGGGMRLLGGSRPITIAQSTFQDNVAGSSIGGLGMTDFYNPLTIVETDFLSNTAQSGHSGGAYIILRAFGEMRMDRVRFQGNRAHSGNAAFYLGVWAPGTAVPPARLTNILFGGNRLTSTDDSSAVLSIYSSGVSNDTDISLAHVTAADNQAPTFLYASAGGTDHAMRVTLTNTLLVSFTNAFAAYEDNSGEALIRHTHTLTDDVTTLHHTVEGTPAFEAINPLSGDSKLDADYRLLPGSDAIDAGVEAGVDHDLDGQPRPEGAAPDIGADEFTPLAVTGAAISGPATGAVGVIHTFTASYTPSLATPPITYTWSPAPDSGQGAAMVTYHWEAPGAKTITVTVENPYGTAPPAVHEIVIEQYHIYLPLVMRNP